MKKYPYTDSTDMIIYEAKPKTKKQRPWLVPIVSALTASVLTASAFTVGFMVIDNGRSNELITFILLLGTCWRCSVIYRLLHGIWHCQLEISYLILVFGTFDKRLSVYQSPNSSVS